MRLYKYPSLKLPVKKFHKEQEKWWIKTCKRTKDCTPERKVASAGLGLAILVQGENLYDDQRASIDGMIVDLAVSLLQI
tara:strand:- start:4355 stop:4591 length:237 start_codon:yes stop_codon:yes gene_type:complete